MSRIPIISGDDFVSAVRQIGYVWDYTKGSHMILVHPSRPRISVPQHRELGRGLLRRLISDAGLTRDEFAKLIR